MMPAIITHDQFGQEALSLPEVPVTTTRQERDAFLLGCQGPDPFFYLLICPGLSDDKRDIGNRMHAETPTRLLAAMSRSVERASASSRRVASAYAGGFLCHYLLDRSAHPFVYAQQYAYCDAGIEGLTREDGNVVHSVIETELDELMLYTRTGQTIATYAPNREILRLDDDALAIVSRQMAGVVKEVYGEYIAPSLFATAVRCFRIVQTLCYSPTGAKREVLGKIEQAVRPYSYVMSMSHRPVVMTESIFDNHAHLSWTDPFSGEARDESFQDLYDLAMVDASAYLAPFMAGKVGFAEARAITHGLDFSGKRAESLEELEG